MSDENELKFTDPDQGMMKLNLRPKVVQRGKCSTEVYDNGQVVVREEHEPDEELEKTVWADQPVCLFDLYKYGSTPVEGAYRKEDKVASVRICKHCGCLYAEKS